MGVGFAVSRFGLFLRELSATKTQLSPHAMGLSTWSGVALVGLGVIVNIGAVVRHVRLVHQLSAGTWIAGRVSMGAVLLALLLAGMGIAMVVYLIFVH